MRAGDGSWRRQERTGHCKEYVNIGFVVTNHRLHVPAHTDETKHTKGGWRVVLLMLCGHTARHTRCPVLL